MSSYALEGIVKQGPKAQVSGGGGGGSELKLLQKIFIFRALDMPFPMFSRGKLNSSKYEKTNYSNK